MIQELFNYLSKVRMSSALNSFGQISAGSDVSYEAGRRIGVIQGMDVMLKSFQDFQQDKDKRNKDL